MRIDNIGNEKSINEYVDHKLKRFNQSDHTFAVLFELMFSEKENILFEKSEGYRIVKTTYGQAYGEVIRRAGVLRHILEDADQDAVVGLHMQNSVEWIENYWAILAAGFRPLLMNLRLDAEVLEETLREIGAVAVVSDGKHFAVRMIPAEALGTDVAEPAEAPAETETSYGTGMPEGCSFGTEILVMSSGTSEHVKVCAYSAEQFHAQINDSYQIIRRCKRMKAHFDGQLKLLTFLPFYHVFGLIAVYIWFSFFSRTFVQLNDMAPMTIVNTIRRHKVTHIFAVPMFWEKVYEQALKTIRERGDATYRKFETGLRIACRIGDVPVLGTWFKRRAFREVRRNLFGESVQFMITGGSAIGRPVMEFFNGIGYHLADGYGMTEIGITSVELSGRTKYLNGCCVGIPFSSMEYRIAEDGELLVRGRAMAKYIIEDGVRTEGGDWFHTRDLAECRKGHYVILGRQDDIVISPSGENLNPNLIEPKLRVPDAENVCLIGERSGDRVAPVLLVSVRDYLTSERLLALEEELKRRMEAINLTAQISRIVFVTDRLIEDNDFKLKRTSIAGKYANGEYHVIVPGEHTDAVPVPDDETIRTIRRIFAAAVGKQPEDVGYEADFFLDCGGTSLDYFALCTELEREYRVAIPVSEGETRKSVRDFYEYIEAENRR